MPTRIAYVERSRKLRKCSSVGSVSLKNLRKNVKGNVEGMRQKSYTYLDLASYRMQLVARRFETTFQGASATDRLHERARGYPSGHHAGSSRSSWDVT